MLMQIQPPNVPREIEPAPRAPPVSVDAADHFEPIREEALLLLRPHRERARTAGMVAGALLAGVALGWAGCLGWNSSAVVAVAPSDAPVRHAEARPAGKSESIRKQAPLVTASINASKPIGSAMRAEPDGSKLAAAILGLPAAPAEPRPQLMPAPETRPTTIEGWTVLDVRGQTAVLQGPDGVRTVTLGETLPGIGRIDSIVRWGNRWIVATANGLIATP
ncbi:hypothetical protein [Bradyrhizobium sp.]|uniref:hypothetical protein n=1 Tax=Bradyrhizobium sp. TaxID=376 RepID=UPI004037F437